MALFYVELIYQLDCCTQHWIISWVLSNFYAWMINRSVLNSFTQKQKNKIPPRFKQWICLRFFNPNTCRFMHNIQWHYKTSSLIGYIFKKKWYIHVQVHFYQFILTKLGILLWLKIAVLHPLCINWLKMLCTNLITTCILNVPFIIICT